MEGMILVESLTPEQLAVMTEEEKRRKFAELQSEMESTFVHRRMRPKQEFNDAEEVRVSKQQKIYDTAADLVRSPAWEIVKRTAAEVLLTYEAPPPRGLDGFIAWSTYGTASDAINKLIAGIEAAALEGQQDNNVEEKEITVYVRN